MGLIKLGFGAILVLCYLATPTTQQRFRPSDEDGPSVTQSPSSTTTFATIVKQINKINDDGSYTFGYEASDGTFRVETRGVDGIVHGRYGFKDPDGKLKIIDYTAGNTTGSNPEEEETEEPHDFVTPPPRPRKPRPPPQQAIQQPTPKPRRPFVAPVAQDEEQVPDLVSNVLRLPQAPPPPPQRRPVPVARVVPRPTFEPQEDFPSQRPSSFNSLPDPVFIPQPQQQGHGGQNSVIDDFLSNLPPQEASQPGVKSIVNEETVFPRQQVRPRPRPVARPPPITLGLPQENGILTHQRQLSGIPRPAEHQEIDSHLQSLPRPVHDLTRPAEEQQRAFPNGFAPFGGPFVPFGQPHHIDQRPRLVPAGQAQGAFFQQPQLVRQHPQQLQQAPRESFTVLIPGGQGGGRPGSPFAVEQPNLRGLFSPMVMRPARLSRPRVVRRPINLRDEE